MTTGVKQVPTNNHRGLHDYNRLCCASCLQLSPTTAYSQKEYSLPVD